MLQSVARLRALRTGCLYLPASLAAAVPRAARRACVGPPLMVCTLVRASRLRPHFASLGRVALPSLCVGQPCCAFVVAFAHCLVTPRGFMLVGFCANLSPPRLDLRLATGRARTRPAAVGRLPVVIRSCFRQHALRLLPSSGWLAIGRLLSPATAGGLDALVRGPAMPGSRCRGHAHLYLVRTAGGLRAPAPGRPLSPAAAGGLDALVRGPAVPGSRCRWHALFLHFPHFLLPRAAGGRVLLHQAGRWRPLRLEALTPLVRGPAVPGSRCRGHAYFYLSRAAGGLRAPAPGRSLAPATAGGLDALVRGPAVPGSRCRGHAYHGRLEACVLLHAGRSLAPATAGGRDALVRGPAVPGRRCRGHAYFCLPRATGGLRAFVPGRSLSPATAGGLTPWCVGRPCSAHRGRAHFLLPHAAGGLCAPAPGRPLSPATVVGPDALVRGLAVPGLRCRGHARFLLPRAAGGLRVPVPDRPLSPAAVVGLDALVRGLAVPGSRCRGYAHFAYLARLAAGVSLPGRSPVFSSLASAHPCLARH